MEATQTIFNFDRPRARRHDPATSHLAGDQAERANDARRVALQYVRPVLRVAAGVPLTDNQIEDFARDVGFVGSGNRIRMGRLYLEETGQIVVAGRGLSRMGKPCRTWRLAGA